MNDKTSDLNKSFKELVEDLKIKYEFTNLGMGQLKTPLTIDFYDSWLTQKFHGSMSYLKNHYEIKKQPKLIQNELKSVISISQLYFPTKYPAHNTSPARVALYAHNYDYHFWLKEKLLGLIADLKLLYPSEVFLPYVDSGPILERDFAYQNGLGWFGKNTCLISREHGSLFFLAEILTSLDFSQTESHNFASSNISVDHCGTCTKCIEICPTQALIAPKTLNATRCISYLTIESKEVPPIDLRSQIGDWFFGCDLCQTICPWNQKIWRKSPVENPKNTSTELNLLLSSDEHTKLIEYFRFLLTSSNKKIIHFHRGTALHRAGAKGLKRNALIVAGNRVLTELTPEISALTSDLFLGELSQWALKQIQNNA